MRLPSTIIWFICVALAAVLLITAGEQLDFINSQRQQMKLISNEPLKNAPPSLAFATIALGAFRGLVVDVLWMRADKLKEQGQFFDARQLAEWITTLQPRFASVWEFQAWNMAYNISAAIPAEQPDQRWQWVKNGYELLRDQGIVLNPRSMLLYRELALIFQHKIGDITDDAHKYYKLQLALAMEPLLGPADNRYFEMLADAPADWRQIINDANLTPLITALKSADKAFTKDNEFVGNYLALRQNAGRFNPEALRTIDRFRGTPALEKLDIFTKAWQLRNVWKLDPVLMQQLNQLCGPVDGNDPNAHLPLDWRNAYSHAMYWAVKGLQTAGKKDVPTTDKDNYSMDEVNTDRIVSHSLQNLFHNGKIFIYDMPALPSSAYSSLPATVPIEAGGPTTKEIFLRPDLRMFEPYNNSILKIIKKYKDAKNRGAYTGMQTGHKNMLKSAVFAFYQSGHIQQAYKIYNQLQKLYPSNEFKDPPDVYVKNRFREEIGLLTFNDVRGIIQMILQEAYFRFAVHDDDEAYVREKIAKEVYDLYGSLYSDENSQKRINLPDFKLLRYLAIVDFFNDRQYPLILKQNLLGRIKVERPELSEQFREQEEELIRKQSEQQK